MTAAALSEVLTGWTGSIVASTADGTVTVVPRVRESVASLFARLAHDAMVELGVDVTFRIGANADPLQPFVYIDTDAALDITFNDNCATRTGYTAPPYEGGTSYAPEEGYTGAYAPTYGLRLNGADLSTSTGRAVADGSSGSHPMRESGQAKLRMATTYAQAWDAEGDVVGVYDVWCEGRVFGRVRIDGWTRTAPGKRRDTFMFLDADVQLVSE